jgi:hypothetical protein
MGSLVHFRNLNPIVSLFVREEIFDEFVELISSRMNKFIAIASVVYDNRHQDDLYKIEKRNPTVTAMKFRNSVNNTRVYCREINAVSGKQVIVCAIHKDKKNQKNQYKENNIIKKVAGYEFPKHS